MDAELIQFLKQFLTPERTQLFDDKIKQRTNYISIVLENIFQPQNASAVLRTADCFGIQTLHIIENEYKYAINPDVVRGASYWLTLHKYYHKENNTREAILKLKKQGYRIIATTPHANDVNLENFNLDAGKAAIMFGSEQPGLSKIALDMADEYVKIPMFGFTESLNISVSAAIIMHHLTLHLRKSTINWQLSEKEENEIMLKWLKTSIRDSEKIVNRFYQLHDKNN